jgi:GDP-L-fucose synthase
MENKILVTGGSGLTGTSLKKVLPNALYVSSKDYDLTNESNVIKMFNDIKPKIVIHLAARVGGILDNIERPADYFTENILMNSLIIKYSHLNKVDRLIGMLSSCIFPDIMDKYPMSEEDLHLGSPPTSNFSYAYSKRSFGVQINAYNKQYNTKYNYLIPCNLYGIGDKDGDKNSHFVTSLIKKIYEANKYGKDHIILYGDGTPIRQFMYVDDLTYVIKQILEKDIYENLNVGTDEILTISEIANIALKACDSTHLKIIYDETKPNGQYRKDISSKKLKNLLPEFKPTLLENGIKKIYKNYLLNNDKIS